MERVDTSKFIDIGPEVGVSPTLLDAVITPSDEFGFIVNARWSSVDRPAGSGIVARTRKLADRLADAMRAGVAVRSEGVARDIDGKTFVLERFAVRARTLNADLTRLGF